MSVTTRAEATIILTRNESTIVTVTVMFTKRVILKQLFPKSSGINATSFLQKEELSARTSSAIPHQRDITLLLIYGRENCAVPVARNSERMFITNTMTAARPSAISVITSSITAMRLIAKRQDLKRKDIAITRLFFSGKWI